MDGRIAALLYFLLITGIGVGAGAGVDAPAPESQHGLAETVGPFGVVGSGDPFDDGAFDGVRKVTLWTGDSGIHRGVISMKVQYVAKENFQIRLNGYDGGADTKINETDFVLAYPEEFITSIKGSLGFYEPYRRRFVLRLVLGTSYGRSQEFGGPINETSINFVLEPEGGRIAKLLVGFFGRSSDSSIYALGAHFISPSSAAKKVDNMSEIVAPPESSFATGYPFDDGVFEGVRKITVREDFRGVNYIRIQYVANENFQIREHGAISINQTETEFEVEYPQEYIIAINISYGYFDPSRSMRVTGIGFVTSYARYEMFAKIYSYYMVEPKNGRGAKLVGFMGRSDDVISTVGVRFYSTTTSSAAKTQSFYCFLGLILLIMDMTL